MSQCLVMSSEADGQLCRLVLNRPKANILDREMTGAIRAAIVELRQFSKLKLIVFEGAGEHFSFGASVAEHQADQVEGMLADFHALFFELESLGIPTAAVVRGQCLGGGLELAIFCGRVFCRPDASLGFPEVKLSVFPPMGAVVLPWRIGGSRATEMILTGASIDGAQAACMGIVDCCCDDPQASLQQWFAEQLQPKSAIGLRYAWRAARLSLRTLMDTQLPQLERMYLSDLMRHTDPSEGISAFMQRRPPLWCDR